LQTSAHLFDAQRLQGDPMSILTPNFNDTVIVRAEEAEVLGWSSVTIRLLADASDTGGALSVMRTTIRARTEAAKPHTHTRSAEMFYVLEGRAEVLSGSRIVTAGEGDLIVVPPNQVHAFATPKNSSAELLIVQAPGLDRFDYFRLIERLMRREATMEDVLATQELYDNHFVESDVWSARRSLHASSKRKPRRERRSR
jgi:mannose-6-phosphate isomerase-like protein (cupin superfamily)